MGSWRPDQNNKRIDWVVGQMLFDIGFGSLGGKDSFSDFFDGGRFSKGGGGV